MTLTNKNNFSNDLFVELYDSFFGRITYPLCLDVVFQLQSSWFVNSY